MEKKKNLGKILFVRKISSTVPKASCLLGRKQTYYDLFGYSREYTNIIQATSHATKMQHNTPLFTKKEPGKLWLQT